MIGRGLRYIWYRLCRWVYIMLFRLKDIDRKTGAPVEIGEAGIRPVWPHGARAAFNLQFDDVSAMNGTLGSYDHGGDPDGTVRSLFLDVLALRPEMKVNLFVVPDPIYKEKGFYGASFMPGQWAIDQQPEFSEWLRGLTQVELSSHGCHHFQKDVRYFLKSREFEFSSADVAAELIRRGIQMCDRVGVSLAGFKPSGWGVGHNADFGLIKGLQTLDLPFVCLSSPVSGLNWDRKRVSDVFPQLYDGVLNIPQNVSLNWPLEQIFSVIDMVVACGGVITLQGHFIEQNNWMSDGIGDGTIKKIEQILRYLDDRYVGEIWFATLGEIAQVARS